MSTHLTPTQELIVAACERALPGAASWEALAVATGYAVPDASMRDNLRQHACNIRRKGIQLWTWHGEGLRLCGTRPVALTRMERDRRARDKASEELVRYSAGAWAEVERQRRTA